MRDAATRARTREKHDTKTQLKKQVNKASGTHNHRKTKRGRTPNIRRPAPHYQSTTHTWQANNRLTESRERDHILLPTHDPHHSTSKLTNSAPILSNHATSPAHSRRNTRTLRTGRHQPPIGGSIIVSRTLLLANLNRLHHCNHFPSVSKR